MVETIVMFRFYEELLHFTHRLELEAYCVCLKAPRFSLRALKTHKAVSFSFAYSELDTRLEACFNKMLWFTMYISSVRGYILVDYYSSS